MKSRPHFFWRRATFLFALLLGMLSILFTQPGAAAQDPQPAYPDVPAPEPIAYGELGELTLSNSFPATPTMTDTVLAVVADLNQMPQPLTPPEGALLPEVQVNSELGPLHHLPHHAYLPTLMRSRTVSREPRTEPADVAVTIWPVPSIRVIRGGLLAYEVRVANYGDGTASGIKVRVPYQRQQMVLANAVFDRGSGDWVSALENEAITVTFGQLAAGARRAGTLYFRVASNLANETVISTRASHSWSDSRRGGQGPSNWAPVLVGVGDANSAYLWLAVSPASGRAGTLHRFYTDRFIPGEGIITWLNTPSGVRPLDIRTTADSYGRVWIDMVSTGLAPGNYGLVVYGARSNLTGVVGFTVQP